MLNSANDGLSQQTSPVTSRRRFLVESANGFGALALAAMTAGCHRQAALPASTGRRAKSVIFLFMEGGPSQVDTFDPKPRLDRDDGRACPFDLPVRLKRERLMRSPFRFAKFGESGADVSELFPHLSQMVDRLAFIRSMTCDFADHPTANYFLHTGTSFRGRPSMGSWVNYGLAKETEDLPSYVVLTGGLMCEGGFDCIRAGFLPPRFQPTILKPGDTPLPDLAPSDSLAVQQRKLALARHLNNRAAEANSVDRHMDAMIDNYELAFRMQSGLPAALDIANETNSVVKLYGLDEAVTRPFGLQCLRARRLVERGVRFVQLIPPQPDGGERWDQHYGLEKFHRMNSLATDKPIAGLLADLASRGLLDETLVLWGGEFGRSPMAESVNLARGIGRDHNRYGFTMWMAGAGIRPGIAYGATDDYGCFAIDRPTTIHDLHATILHLLGLDHTKLVYAHSGRNYRLTDVFGNVIHGLLV
jgi:hypothetical protein